MSKRPSTTGLPPDLRRLSGRINHLEKEIAELKEMIEKQNRSDRKSSPHTRPRGPAVRRRTTEPH